MNAVLKLVEPQPDNEATLRKTLRLAIEQRDSALATRDKARAAADAAQQRLDEIDEELERFASLDEDIAQARASQIAISLEAGGGFPKLETPAELVALSAQRDVQKNTQAAINHALTRLQSSLKEAERVLATHEANTATAARAVVAHYGDALAYDLGEIEQKAAELRNHLLGVTALRLGGAFPVAAQTVALLRDAPVNSLYSRNSSANASWWDSYFKRLCISHEAQPED